MDDETARVEIKIADGNSVIVSIPRQCSEQIAFSLQGVQAEMPVQAPEPPPPIPPPPPAAH